MGGRVLLSFLLVLLCSSNGWTQTSNPPSTGTGGYHCTRREGTSFTVLMDEILTYDLFWYYLEKILNSVSARFPCVTRQYTTVTVDYAETKENNTNDKSVFRQSITRNTAKDHSVYDYYYNHALNCNQSLLYGLKRALEISPAESIIWVYTVGSMVDYNDTRLLSEVYTLLEEKKSKVYFQLYSGGYCTMPASQQDVLNKISSLSYGKCMNFGNTDDYKLILSLKLLLSKPINSSVNILNINRNVTDKYTEVFNIPISLTYLLITRDEQLTLNITDPNGNKFTLDKNPHYYDHTHNYDILSSHLIKSPAAGSWILNVQGNSSLSVQIMGFTGLDKAGNCSDSGCHPNATCSEFGGYGECTCKEGFAGDGTTCNDIDECQDYEFNNCHVYGGVSCKNTIGSFSCNCSAGFFYVSEFGCVDID